MHVHLDDAALSDVGTPSTAPVAASPPSTDSGATAGFAPDPSHSVARARGLLPRGPLCGGPEPRRHACRREPSNALPLSPPHDASRRGNQCPPPPRPPPSPPQPPRLP